MLRTDAPPRNLGRFGNHHAGRTMHAPFTASQSAGNPRPQTPGGPTDRGGTTSTAKLSRRAALGMLAAGAIGGCQPNATPDAATDDSPRRSNVPLRVTLVGDQHEADAIRSAWALTSEQPLDIRRVGLGGRPLDAPVDADQPKPDDGEDGGELDEAKLVENWQDAALQSDVMIIPQSLIGTLTAAEAIIEFQASLLEEYRQDYGALFPAVRNGLGNYGGRRWGVPGGAKTLALLTSDTDADAETWAEYHQRVEAIDGRAAEPLAGGWAAASYLHRCATSIDRGWMFNRSDMEPLIDEPEYVAVLQQLAETAELYRQTDVTPRAIWERMRRGELRVAIGFECPLVTVEDAAATSDGDVFDIGVSTGPVEIEGERIWFPQSTPLACISSGCRQTDASKRLVGWLSGGESVDGVRQQTNRFSQTRQAVQQNPSELQNAYTRWLSERLSTLQAVPSLTLPGGSRYYDALDQQVRRCVAGEASAKEALSAAKQDWQRITDRLGRPGQLAAWKRVLGFGG